MATLIEDDLRLFVDAVKHYLKATTRQLPEITAAYLGDATLMGHEFNGTVRFSGAFRGQVTVSMPSGLLGELLVLQHETRPQTKPLLLDAVGEIANTLAGNARKTLGPELEISVPQVHMGKLSLNAQVRQRPYVISLRWNTYPALVCIDLERTAPR